MYSITFNCKTLTPMFMAGAFSNSPELRAPSIKGIIRFWWRAMNGQLSIDELRKKETEIFGGSGENQGKSRVRIKVKFRERIVGRNLKTDYSLKWKFNKEKQNLEGTHAGIGYILYSTVLLGKEKEYLKDNNTFSIEFASNHDDEALKQAIASFWCAVNLGGFGSRSRRGGGNIIVTSIEDNSSIISEMNINFSPSGNESNDIASWIIGNFNKAKGIVAGEESSFISEYSNLSFSRFIISNEHFNNWINALNDIGTIFKIFRDNHRSDIFDAAVFGLPVRHHNMTVKGKYRNESFERRSSPIIFKVIKVERNYFWMVFRFAGEFLPEGGVILANGKTQKPYYKLIDEFWNHVKNKGKEFILSKPKKLDELINKIKEESAIKKIILFGSKAVGDFHKKSDIDIAVDSNNSFNDDRIHGAVDIVNLQNAQAYLKQKIGKDGVVIYERKD